MNIGYFASFGKTRLDQFDVIPANVQTRKVGISVEHPA